jgi:hypothetical protein
MEIFVWDTESYMNMHDKIQNIIKYRYLQLIIFAFEFLQCCTMP